MRAISAEEIAVAMGLQVNPLPLDAKRGIRAKFAQYVQQQEGRNVCMAEVINAKRNRYSPQDCARRGQR